MFLGKPRSVTCDFTTSTLRCWPGIHNSTTDKAVSGNYLAILILAWGYVLSAKWVQLAGNGANITLHPQVHLNDVTPDDIIIDIGEPSDDAIRWWTAILSQHQGWSATIDYNGPSQVVNPILRSTDQVRLARLFAQRQPRLAAFWLGAIITGFHTTLITRFLKERVRLMDIHDLAWTSTLNSFIFDVPTVVEPGIQHISRKHECRLLLILDQDATVPISPWKPFGDTTSKDAAVQIHARCGHSLRYTG